MCLQTDILRHFIWFIIHNPTSSKKEFQKSQIVGQIDLNWKRFMYAPSLVSLNITENKVKPKKTIDPKVVELFLGGRGIAVYLSFESIPVDTSPRGPENIITFGTGFLTGSTFPSSGTAIATFKSPHTNTLCTATSTGHFGAFLKQTGHDFLQIQGKAKSPQYILIDEFSDISFEDASNIWEYSIEKTDRFFREKYGDRISIACIGNAAINQVIYTGVVVDRRHQFQRGGLGSVFASKNIKAIVLTDPPQTSDLSVLTEEEKVNFESTLLHHPWISMLTTEGTFSTIHSMIQAQIVPTKNCTRLFKLQKESVSSFHGYGETYNCWQCQVQCKRNSSQSFIALGPNLGIVDHNSVQKAIEKCDEEGLDPISTGAALASLFQIQEDKRKLLNINLGYNWGNPQIYKLIDDIIKKKGLGDQLARGEGYLYKQTSEPSPMVKNQIPGMYFFPNCPVLSMDLCSAPYGASDLRTGSLFYPEVLGFPFQLSRRSVKGKIQLKILLENLAAVFDSLVLCSRFMPTFLKSSIPFRVLPSRLRGLLLNYLPKRVIENMIIRDSLIGPLIRKSIQLENSNRNILEIGNRITLLERLFNTRTGLLPSSDLIPRYLEGYNEFYKQQNELLVSYYKLKGLNSEGLITLKTLKKAKLLGLLNI